MRDIGYILGLAFSTFSNHQMSDKKQTTQDVVERIDFYLWQEYQKDQAKIVNDKRTKTSILKPESSFAVKDPTEPAPSVHEEAPRSPPQHDPSQPPSRKEPSQASPS